MQDKNSQNNGTQNNFQQNKGNEFWNVVQNAINTGNYQELNHKVQNTITDTADGIRSITDELLDSFLNSTQPKPPAATDYRRTTQAWQERSASNRTASGRTAGSRTASAQAAQTITQESWASRAENYAQTKKSRQALYIKNPPGKLTGLFQMIFGFTMTIPAAIWEAIMLVAVLDFTDWGSMIVLAVMLLFSSAFLGAMIALGVSGVKKWKFANRFQEYVRILGNRAYCDIQEIQERTGRKKTAIVKDLKRMIVRRFFLQGHLDQKETCLIVSHEMYNQYLQVEKQAKERELLEQAEKAKLDKVPEECRNILAEGKAYIAFIREANDKLPGEVISTKLDRLEVIITRIFAEVEQKTELAGDLRRFMNYYLPTTKKLVQAYCDLEQEPISSDNMQKTKREIEDTLDTINQAFENLLNSFFDTKALDISSDISALNTMLAQEGLTQKNPFEV